MKKTLALLLTLAMLVLALSACDTTGKPADTTASGDTAAEDTTKAEEPSPEELRRNEIHELIRKLISEDGNGTGLSTEIKKNPLEFLKQDYSILDVEDNAFGIKGLIRKDGCSAEIYDGSYFETDSFTVYYVPTDDYVIGVMEADGEFEFSDYDYNYGDSASLLDNFNFSILNIVTSVSEEDEDPSGTKIEITDPTEEDFVISEDLNTVSLSEDYLKKVTEEINDALSSSYREETGDETSECPIVFTVRSYVIDVDTKEHTLVMDASIDINELSGLGGFDDTEFLPDEYDEELFDEELLDEEPAEPSEPIVFTCTARISDPLGDTVTAEVSAEGSGKIEGADTEINASFTFENICFNEAKDAITSAKIDAMLNYKLESEEFGKVDNTISFGIDLNAAEEGKETVTLYEETKTSVEQSSATSSGTMKNTITFDLGNSTLEYEIETDGSSAKLVAKDVKFGDDVTIGIPEEVLRIAQEMLPEIIAYESIPYEDI